MLKPEELICTCAQKVTDADLAALEQLGVRDRGLAEQGKVGVARNVYHHGSVPLSGLTLVGEDADHARRISTPGSLTMVTSADEGVR